ncbi:MAG TPA: hypothetical protein VJY62_11135, partial [Bacteroidia bacterium]|nr:hypothetical protein [Bacteroidia bacterium]
AFLKSIEMANQRVTGYEARKFAASNFNQAEILLKENPKLIGEFSPIKVVDGFSGQYYETSATVGINDNKYEITAEAVKKSILSTWKENIKNFFGVKSNNLDDILKNADKTIRKTYPKDHYKVKVNSYPFSFTINVRKKDDSWLANH